MLGYRISVGVRVWVAVRVMERVRDRIRAKLLTVITVHSFDEYYFKR